MAEQVLPIQQQGGKDDYPAGVHPDNKSMACLENAVCKSFTETSTVQIGGPGFSTSTSTSGEISKEPTKSIGPWDVDECRKISSELFTSSEILHSYSICSAKSCTCLSKDEVARLLPKKFTHSWLNRTNWWLCYVEGQGMFCLACKKHNMKHPQNLKEVFSATPSVRFKVDAVATHSKSSLHSAALESELLQKVSFFHQEVTKKADVETSVLEKSFATAYFLMKEFIANRKFLPLLNFIQKMYEIDSLKYFQHRSAGSQMEIFKTLGDTVKEELLEKVNKALAYGLLTDEVADVSVTENLVTFVQYFCRETEKVETSFLSCHNIFTEFESANAEAISSLILKELENDGLQISKFTGITSDGAAVMLGKKSGVAARLKKENPALISIHCVCHRLALSCTDSNEAISYIKTVETLLRQLWQFFENSPKRMAAYMKVQVELKSIRLGNQASKKVARRLKKACRTRWLSLDASVSAVHGDFEAILQTLSLFQETDATASGLLKKMRSLKFLGAIYILNSVLPILSNLSRHFQKGSLNFSAILPAINLTKDKLTQLKDEKTPLELLSRDIESFTDMCSEIRLNGKESNELHGLLHKYIEALVLNIDRRFSDCSTVLSAFAIFDPLAIPAPSDAGFKDYGINQITVLADHFFAIDTIRGDKLNTQWQGMKYHINDALRPNMPDDVKSSSCSQTPTDWLLLQLLRNTSLRQLFPEFVYIAEVAASLPVTNAWPERGASALKNVKTRLRNRLSPAMLEGILHVTINGPPPEESYQLIERAVRSWLDRKGRRKLPKPKLARPLQQQIEQQHEVTVTTDAAIQTDEAELDIRAEVSHALKEMLVNNDDSGSDYSDDDDFCQPDY